MLSTLQLSAVDGDTIRAGPDRIRLRGIDTPELSEPEGEAAKQRLAELLRTGIVRIIPRGRDVYDRLIAGMTCFFDQGIAPASIDDIVENVRVMEAANASMQRDGAWVSL
ncbi:MAG: hypothetical protein HC794_01670 [Nitrospiraceae bacterium]|nr:hypothetical protein [Nitrospiraceae bacterium]